MTDAFFVPDGPAAFVPTDYTIGPWDARAQHGGPPAALLGRAVEHASGGEGKRIARIVFDLLRPVPLGLLSVACEVGRPGRRVDLVSAALSAEGEVMMRASAWRIRTTELNLPQPSSVHPPGPEDAREVDLFDNPAGPDRSSYLDAMDIRFTSGAFLEPGPATAWFRARHPLVAGEENSSLTAVLIAIDSASGVSAELDPRKWLFVNPDLSVHLTRYPTDDWVCIDAATLIEPSGIGMAGATIGDRRGTIGRSSQSLLIDTR